MGISSPEWAMTAQGDHLMRRSFLLARSRDLVFNSTLSMRLTEKGQATLLMITVLI